MSFQNRHKTFANQNQHICPPFLPCQPISNIPIIIIHSNWLFSEIFLNWYIKYINVQMCQICSKQVQLCNQNKHIYFLNYL